MLEEVARMAIARAFVQEEARDLERRARAHAYMAKLPDDLAERVASALAKHPEMAWEQAVEQIVQQ